MVTGIKMTTIITPRCFKCGQEGELQIPSEIWFAGKRKREQGALIQDAWPSLNAEQREQIMTGIHPQCWQRIFPK